MLKASTPTPPPIFNLSDDLRHHHHHRNLHAFTSLLLLVQGEYGGTEQGGEGGEVRDDVINILINISLK